MPMRDRALPLLLASDALASIGTGIAMIAIPWLLAGQPGGAVIFGGLATVVNLALFAITPFIGPLIDRTSRKSLMLRLRGSYIIGLLMVWIVDRCSTPEQAMVPMIMYYVLGASFYCFNVPLRSAYSRGLFSVERQSRMNALLEIENQVAAVLTGLLAIVVAQRCGLATLLAGNAALYAAAIGMIVLIPEAGEEGRDGTGGHRFLAALIDGARLASDRPGVALQLAASSVPYVVVILYTVLNPISLARLSQGNASAYAIVEMLFAFGSVAGGSLMMRRRSADIRLAPALTISLVAFAGVAVVQAALVTTSAFMALAVAFGFGNAVCRILRQTLMMAEIPAHQIGRVASFLQSLTMLMRTVSLLVLTEILSGRSTGAALWFCALLSVSAPALFVAATALRPSRAAGLLLNQDQTR